MTDQFEMFEEQPLFDTNQDLKVCIKCSNNLPLSCFKDVGGSRRVDGTSSLRNKCISCYNEESKQRSSLHRTNPKPDENYKCPICLSNSGSYSDKIYDSTCQYLSNSWCLDHNHKTGEFRGWLCKKCNSALGWFEDDINYLKRAIKYLENND